MTFPMCSMSLELPFNVGSYVFSVLKLCCSYRNPDGTFPDGSPLKRVVRTSALNKSFSSAIAARRDIRPAEKPHHKLSRIEYTSIDQFQQRTELYRGRCIASLQLTPHYGSELPNVCRHPAVSCFCFSSIPCLGNICMMVWVAVLQHFDCVQGYLHSLTDARHHQGV